MQLDEAMDTETTVTLTEALRELHRHGVRNVDEIKEALADADIGNGEYSTRALLIFLGY